MVLNVYQKKFQLGKGHSRIKKKTLRLKIFKTLQYNVTGIFDINSSNRMFCSMHDFISKTLSLNLCHCYLKYRRLQQFFCLTLILKVRILDIPKPSRNGTGYLILQNFRGTRRDQKNKISYMNCLITYMFTGLLLLRAFGPAFYCTALGYISRNEKYNPE